MQTYCAPIVQVSDRWKFNGPVNAQILLCWFVQTTKSIGNLVSNSMHNHSKLLSISSSHRWRELGMTSFRLSWTALWWINGTSVLTRTPSSMPGD